MLTMCAEFNKRLGEGGGDKDDKIKELTTIVTGSIPSIPWVHTSFKTVGAHLLQNEASA